MSDMVREEITRRIAFENELASTVMPRRQQALPAAWRQVCWAFLSS